MYLVFICVPGEVLVAFVSFKCQSIPLCVYFTLKWETKNWGQDGILSIHRCTPPPPPPNRLDCQWTYPSTQIISEPTPIKKQKHPHPHPSNFKTLLLIKKWYKMANKYARTVTDKCCPFTSVLALFFFFFYFLCGCILFSGASIQSWPEPANHHCWITAAHWVECQTRDADDSCIR